MKRRNKILPSECVLHSYWKILVFHNLSSSLVTIFKYLHDFAREKRKCLKHSLREQKCNIFLLGHTYTPCKLYKNVQTIDTVYLA